MVFWSSLDTPELNYLELNLYFQLQFIEKQHIFLGYAVNKLSSILGIISLPLDSIPSCIKV